jgi:hypothetical protein
MDVVHLLLTVLVAGSSLQLHTCPWRIHTPATMGVL